MLEPTYIQVLTTDWFNPFKANGLAYPYSKGGPISNFNGVGWYFSLQILIEHPVSKSVGTDSAVFDPGCYMPGVTRK